MLASGPRPRLLYVVSEDWYFLSHRLPMARAARDAGFDVHVATHVQHGAEAIRREGFTLHGIPFERGKLSIGAGLRTVRAVRAIHDDIHPVLAHHVSLQPAVLASMAALGRDVACVNAVTGFGFAFTSTSLKARAIRPAISALLRWLLGRPSSIALVQNPDDRAALLALRVPADQIVCIAGSGVDLERFTPTPEPAGRITVGFVGRLLADKGVHTLVEAHRLLKQRGVEIALQMAGTPDPANPSTVSEMELTQWSAEGISVLGHVEDIPTFWASTHIAVLPSRREGLPKSLLEAAASGRPMVASDVPGCREVVGPTTGLLVRVDDPEALANAIETLATSPELRHQMGAAARRDAEARFGNARIARETVALYQKLLSARA